MNSITKQIMQILNINVKLANKVQFEMECNGFDFSECSDRQFIREVKSTAASVL